MRWFLLTTLGFLILAILGTVVAWYVVQQELASEANPAVAPDAEDVAPESESVSESTPTLPPEDVMVENVLEPATVTEEVPGAAEQAASETDRSIPLRDLPLTDEQASLLVNFGIDRETFIITESMIVCAEEKLGQARFTEITNGASPDFFEAVDLLRCLE